MAYGDFKHIKRRTASDKISRNKAFNIAKNSKYDGYQRGLASMVYKFFDKKSTGSGIVNNNNNNNITIIIIIIRIRMILNKIGIHWTWLCYI